MNKKAIITSYADWVKGFVIGLILAVGAVVGILLLKGINPLSLLANEGP